MVEIRRLSEEDWEILRAVRLAALGDSPTAFASTLERELALDERLWRDRAGSGAWWVGFDEAGEMGGAGQSSVPAGAGPAERGDAAAGPVGVVAGAPGGASGDRHLTAMWVAPARRGHGVSGLLVDRVVAWARADGGTRLLLWVVTTNEPARRLYGRHGFRPTGVSQQLPSHPALEEIELAIDPL